MRSDLAALAELLPRGALLTSEADLAVYSYDAALDRGRPEAVALPSSAEETAALLAYCSREGVPFTARGAGTNLSGGCIPLRGGLVVSLARMSRILEVDTARGFALVEPGVVNLALQKELEAVGFFYAPDPASFRVSTIGGNIAENAGGPRCLKYGTTTNHVLAVEAAMPDGSLARFSAQDAGPELMSLLVGAEGTLGIVTKAWLRILPIPLNIRTFLAGFDSIDAAVECVSAIIAAGVLPRVLEALDRVTVESVEAYSHAGYPKAEAVLLIELDGPEAEVDADSRLVEGLCRKSGARDFKTAADPAQRERLWEGRRGAYAAMARLAPNVMVEDGVVPRDKLPEVVRRIREITGRHGLTAGLLFHAGDGNIHPNVAYDERDPDQVRRIKAAGREILQACVELGGSLSGEHGIGVDKRAAMAWLFSHETLGLFRRVKSAFDPKDLSNPDKVIPLPGEEGTAAPLVKPPARPLSPAAQALVARVRDCARAGHGMLVRGAGTRLTREPAGLAVVETAPLAAVAELDLGNLTVTAEAGIRVADLHARLKEKGLYIRLPAHGGTLGGLLSLKPWPAVREDLLGMRLLLADGTLAEFGGKVVKNVAGYDLARAVLGSRGSLGVILEATFKLYARPQAPWPPEPPERDFSPGPWQRRVKSAFDPANLLNPWLFA